MFNKHKNEKRVLASTFASISYFFLPFLHKNVACL